MSSAYLRFQGGTLVAGRVLDLLWFSIGHIFFFGVEENWRWIVELLICLMFSFFDIIHYLFS